MSTRGTPALRAGLLGLAIALCGCGAGAAHVIGPGVSTPPTTSSPAGSGNPANAGTTTTTAVSSTGSSITPSEEEQIASLLNALDASLGQANNDLTNPNSGDK